MLGSSTLPEGLAFSRATAEFTESTVPAGLLRAHRVAEGSFGLLRVLGGELRFVLEDSGEARTLRAGEAQIVPPGVLHHVELAEGARFLVEFYRKA